MFPIPRSLGRTMLTVTGWIAVAAGALWGGLVLVYQAPGQIAVDVAVVMWVALALIAAAGLWRGRPAWSLPFIVALAALLVWYVGLSATNASDWATEVSRPLTADIQGDHVVVHDVRNFAWRSDTDFTPRWEERSYDLGDLVSLDLVNSYWTGPLIAHTLLSFGFRDGRHLAFSIEIRRRVDQEFSSLAGFVRSYGLIFVAADERDILFVRTNIRHEDVQLYRLQVPLDDVRRLFVDLLGRANRLARHPDFYNTLTRNCTTELFDAAHDIKPGLAFDWRILVSGYVPEYAYEHALLDRRYPIEELRRTSHVSPLGQSGSDDAGYSTRVRANLLGRSDLPSGQGR